MKYIINNAGIVLFIDNKQIKVEKNNLKYAKVMETFNLPKEDQENAVKEIVFQSNKKDDAEKKGFVITDSEVRYKNQKLPDVLADKIRSIYDQGLPVDIFEKFWENLNLNPSSSSVNELYDFLQYKELPITEDGMFLAYKGVDEKYWSIHGNPNTVVITGQVNSSGKIFNGIGEVIEVQRRDVDDNRDNHCSFGLHCGQIDYSKSFGQKVVVVKVNPKDVVSVPKDYNCQKLRCCKYEVIADFVEEIVHAATDENGVGIESLDHKEHKEATANRGKFLDKIDAYIHKKALETKGLCRITVRQIQNSFSPDYPSKESVLDALQDLGYSWEKENNEFVIYI